MILYWVGVDVEMAQRINQKFYLIYQVQNEIRMRDSFCRMMENRRSTYHVESLDQNIKASNLAKYSKKRY